MKPGIRSIEHTLSGLSMRKLCQVDWTNSPDQANIKFYASFLASSFLSDSSMSSAVEVDLEKNLREDYYY